MNKNKFSCKLNVNNMTQKLFNEFIRDNLSVENKLQLYIKKKEMKENEFKYDYYFTVKNAKEYWLNKWRERISNNLDKFDILENEEELAKDYYEEVNKDNTINRCDCLEIKDTYMRYIKINDIWKGALFSEELAMRNLLKELEFEFDIIFNIQTKHIELYFVFKDDNVSKVNMKIKKLKNILKTNVKKYELWLSNNRKKFMFFQNKYHSLKFYEKIKPFKIDFFNVDSKIKSNEELTKYQNLNTELLNLPLIKNRFNNTFNEEKELTFKTPFDNNFYIPVFPKENLSSFNLVLGNNQSNRKFLNYLSKNNIYNICFNFVNENNNQDFIKINNLNLFDDREYQFDKFEIIKYFLSINEDLFHNNKLLPSVKFIIKKIISKNFNENNQNESFSLDTIINSLNQELLLELKEFKNNIKDYTFNSKIKKIYFLIEKIDFDLIKTIKETLLKRQENEKNKLFNEQENTLSQIIDNNKGKEFCFEYNKYLEIYLFKIIDYIITKKDKTKELETYAINVGDLNNKIFNSVLDFKSLLNVLKRKCEKHNIRILLVGNFNVGNEVLVDTNNIFVTHYSAYNSLENLKLLPEDSIPHEGFLYYKNSNSIINKHLKGNVLKYKSNINKGGQVSSSPD